MNQYRASRVEQMLAALGKSVCYLSLFLGMQVAVMIPVMVAVAAEELRGGSVMDEDALTAMMNADAMTLTLISGLLTIVVVLAIYLIRRKKLSEALMLRPVPVPTLLTAASLVPALYLLVTIFLMLLPQEWSQSYIEASAGIDSGSLIGIISVAVVAPIVEEFIFRGLIMNRLSRVMPGWLAVVLSAAVFGVCHGHPVWFAYAFALGGFFGFIDLRTGSIWPSILGHVAFNAIGQIVTFVPETEEGTELLIVLGTLLVVGIAAPLFNRRAVGALFHPAPQPQFTPMSLPGQELELPTQPGTYEFDPWDE